MRPPSKIRPQRRRDLTLILKCLDLNSIKAYVGVSTGMQTLIYWEIDQHLKEFKLKHVPLPDLNVAWLPRSEEEGKACLAHHERPLKRSNVVMVHRICGPKCPCGMSARRD